MGGRTHVLDRTRAEELLTELEDALEESLEFVHTTGEHRRNGEYVVARRGAESAGNRKVFPSFAHLARLYRRLPDRFTADDLTRTGLTAGRRHMVLWHLVEHPDFDCSLTSRQPLTVEKARSAPCSTGPTETTRPGDSPAPGQPAEDGATRGWSD